VISQVTTVEAGTDRDSVVRAYRAHVNRGLANLASMLGAPLEVRSQGALVYDEHGSAYLDCGGYGVFLLGHGHPRVVGAVSDQLHRHPLATRMLVEPRLAEAATALASIAPAPLEYVFLTNSGAEAVELGLKLARANGRRRVIAMQGGFHGKTLGALTATGRAAFREPFSPLLPAVQHVRYGDADALRQALAADPEPACVLLEPVQAEGGVRIPLSGYLTAVRTLCDRFGAMLVLDEVQTGLGRLGSWWGCDPERVIPDVLLAGKTLSGGVVPVGAVVTTAEVFGVLNRDPLLHTSTYGGNPLAAAAVAATIGALRDEQLVERAAGLGEHLLRELRHILFNRTGDPLIEVRGRGLLLGIDCSTPPVAAELLAELLARRVITTYSLNCGNVLRLTPPAVLDDGQVDWLLSAVDGAVATITSRVA
jgi:putrescine aminotransferase